jgi:hypothetical protein
MLSGPVPLEGTTDFRRRPLRVTLNDVAELLP